MLNALQENWIISTSDADLAAYMVAISSDFNRLSILLQNMPYEEQLKELGLFSLGEKEAEVETLLLCSNTWKVLTGRVGPVSSHGWQDEGKWPQVAPGEV